MRAANVVFCCLLLCLTLSSVSLSQGDPTDTVRLGPTGGFGGKPFADEKIPSAAQTRVARVVVAGAKLVDRVQMVHMPREGTQPMPLGSHGGPGGSEGIFELQEGEYITAIRGRYGSVIDSIVFETSKGRQSPRFGGEGGRADYVYQAPPGWEIAGFHGRGAKFLDAIGVILRPVAP